MRKKQFFEDLNILCRRLNQNFNINDGYCYYVAYLVAKFCEKNGIDYEFVGYREYYRDDMYHYGIKVGDIIINPDSSGTAYYRCHYIKQDSKWMYELHKQNYKPKLSYYWKDYNKRYVNRELKYIFGKYQQY